MHPYHHAVSSAKKFGGVPDDYIQIHSWFDQSKAGYADFRHRAMLHHSEGIFLAERQFGVTITNSQGTRVPTRQIGEQHVKEDLGWIPSMKDWLKTMQAEKWMVGRSGRINTDEEMAQEQLESNMLSSDKGWEQHARENQP